VVHRFHRHPSSAFVVIAPHALHVVVLRFAVPFVLFLATDKFPSAHPHSTRVWRTRHTNHTANKSTNTLSTVVVTPTRVESSE
jgi:hypothetical protein